MNVPIKILAGLNLLGAMQGLLLACALLSLKQGNQLAQRLLAAFVASVSIVIGGAVILTSGFAHTFPHLGWVHHPFSFLLMPLLYLHLRTLSGEQTAIARHDLWHFALFALCASYLAPFYMQNAAAKLAIIGSAENLRWYYVRTAIGAAQAVFYFWLLAALVSKLTDRLKSRPSAPDQAVLRHARLLVGAWAVLWAVAWVRLVLNDHGTLTNLLIPLAASTMIYALAYQVLRQPTALLSYEIPVALKKYERSKLTPERAEEYLQRLQHAMRVAKPYLDGGLTLQKMAELLAVPAPHLSQLVNERLGQSFSDFINAHRVAEAQAIMRDPARHHYSLLAIASEAGFNSKSSFNAVFKKHTSQTPSEFRTALATTSLTAAEN